VNYEAAKKWIQEQDWTEEKELDASNDEHALLMFIYNQMQTVRWNGGSADKTITELIEISHSKHDDDITSDRARNHLKRIGILVEANSIAVSNTHEFIKRMLRDTPWSKNHNKILLRIPGAVATPPIRFSGQAQSRAVRIPIEFGSPMMFSDEPPY
jgi:hypothetical protein